MFDTTKALSNLEKEIHNLISPYITNLGFMDLGNHFEVFNYIENNSQLLDFLKNECKLYKENNCTEIKKYSYLDLAIHPEKDIDYYYPKLIFIDKNYVINIDSDKRIAVYDHSLNKLYWYKISILSDDIGALSVLNSKFYSNKSDEYTTIPLDNNASLKKSNIKDNTYRYEDDWNTQLCFDLIFKKNEINLIFNNYFESPTFIKKIIIDYDLNIKELTLNDYVIDNLNIGSLKNLNSYEDLLLQIKPNLEIFHIKNDFEYTLSCSEVDFNNIFKETEKIINLKVELDNAFESILSNINLCKQENIISNNIKLLKYYPDKFEEFDMVKEINEKYKKNNFYQDPILNGYYSIISTLTLLKENNESLIDYTIINKLSNIDNTIINFKKLYNKNTIENKLKI